MNLLVFLCGFHVFGSNFSGYLSMGDFFLVDFVLIISYFYEVGTLICCNCSLMSFFFLSLFNELFDLKF